MKLMALRGGLSSSNFHALEPYFDRMDEQCLWSIDYAADSAGMMEWAERHIWPRVPALKNRGSRKAEFIAGLEKSLDSRWRVPPESYCQRYLRGGCRPGQLLDSIFDWLGCNADERALTVAAEVLACLGGRNDVERFRTVVVARGSALMIDGILKDVSFRIQRATLAGTADEREHAPLE